MSLGFGMGRLYAPDTRDEKFRLSLVSHMLEPQMSRRKPYKLQAPIDQGDTPSCTGASFRNWMNAAPVMSSPNYGPSYLEIYRLAQQMDEWPGENYDGSSVRGAWKAMRFLGYSPAVAWADNSRDAHTFMLQGYGTAILGTNWYESMFTVDGDGFIVEPGPLDTPVGGHAYHAYWYDAAQNAFWIQNSWGERWGHGGCGRMRRGLFDRLIREEGECACPVQHVIYK